VRSTPRCGYTAPSASCAAPTEPNSAATSKALAEAGIGEDARAKILHRNAAAMMSRLAKVAQRETVAA
jgi:hypothetical protein